MKHLYLFFIPFLFFVKTTAQNRNNEIEFTSDNKKISGKLITPLSDLKVDIIVELSNAEKLNFKIKDLNEITINNESYVSSFNKVDLNLTNNESYLDENSNPNFKEVWMLLKILVSGDYNLYEYNSGVFNQFYFNSSESKEIKPLIFKKYKTSSTSTSFNGMFRNQLYKEAKHPTYSYERYKKIEYKKKTLMKYFNEINNYDADQGIRKTVYTFSVFAGVSSNTLISTFGDNPVPKIYLPFSLDNNPLKSHTSSIIGISGELFLNSKSNNALFLETGFSTYSSSYYQEINSLGISDLQYDIKANMLLLNVGYKRYFNISKNSQFYGQISISINYFMVSKNEISFQNPIYYHKEKNKSSISDLGGRVGVGYKLNKKYYIEANIRDGFKPFGIFTSSRISSVTLGYTF